MMPDSFFTGGRGTREKKSQPNNASVSWLTILMQAGVDETAVRR
jgi:hypothetical protein